MASRVVHFGLFELDLKTGELRKQGVKQHLARQPFEVLAALVERAGDLVTRGELRTRLWPDAVFVDFEQGLNKAVATIRRALGDRAESPRFVETLERRGYRFIAAVGTVDAAGGPVHRTAGSAASIQLMWGDRSIALAEGTHYIGRDPDLTVCVSSSVVSRRHAAMVVAGTSITIEDLGSKNGTLVNGQNLLKRTLLVDGDEIQVGPAKLLVAFARPDISTATANIKA